MNVASEFKGARKVHAIQATEWCIANTPLRTPSCRELIDVFLIAGYCGLAQHMATVGDAVVRLPDATL